jgi:hypothetical protein
MNITNTSHDTRRAEDCPAAWFVVLDRARRTNDLALAERARRELRRLGVVIEFTDQSQPVAVQEDAYVAR